MNHQIKNPRRWIGPGLLALACLSSSAFAQKAEVDPEVRAQRKQVVLERFDLDGDGQIGESEKQAMREARQARRDQNGAAEQGKTRPRERAGSSSRRARSGQRASEDRAQGRAGGGARFRAEGRLRGEFRRRAPEARGEASVRSRRGEGMQRRARFLAKRWRAQTLRSEAGPQRGARGLRAENGTRKQSIERSQRQRARFHFQQRAGRKGFQRSELGAKARRFEARRGADRGFRGELPQRTRRGLRSEAPQRAERQWAKKRRERFQEEF